MSSLPATPGQTVGPFFRYGVEFPQWNVLVPESSENMMRLRGYVLDGNGDPIPDALIELWQADSAGHIPRVTGSLNRNSEEFTGWGRTHTTQAGEYEFLTVEPGARFFAVAVFARGLLDVLHTRIYLPEVGPDELLDRLESEERESLIAKRTADGLRHDIRLQGVRETVFLAYR